MGLSDLRILARKLWRPLGHPTQVLASSTLGYLQQLLSPFSRFREVFSYKSAQTSTGGSVVEFSPATREARVRFPASAHFLYATILFSFIEQPMSHYPANVFNHFIPSQVRFPKPL